MRSISQASGALHELARLLPSTAQRIAGERIEDIIGLSRATYRKMIQNLWWAAGYNIFAIPLAAGVLADQGILLHMRSPRSSCLRVPSSSQRTRSCCNGLASSTCLNAH